jgi:hypothetical protein
MSGNLYSGIKFNELSSTMMSIKRFCIFLFSHQMKNTGPLKIQICSPVAPGEKKVHFSLNYLLKHSALKIFEKYYYL